jgi:hypothetical protein
VKDYIKLKKLKIGDRLFGKAASNTNMISKMNAKIGKTKTTMKNPILSISFGIFKI